MRRDGTRSSHFFVMFASVLKEWDKEYSTQMLDKLIPENLVDEFILLR
jgi:hypothetical protein